MSTKLDKLHNYTVIARLDDAIPLNTDEWITVERLLNQVSEFIPMSMLHTLTEAVIGYADDQARRGLFARSRRSRKRTKEIKHLEWLSRRELKAPLLMEII